LYIYKKIKFGFNLEINEIVSLKEKTEYKIRNIGIKLILSRDINIWHYHMARGKILFF